MPGPTIRSAAWRYVPAAIVAACYLPLILLHMLETLADDRYRHVPLVMGATAGLCWYRWPSSGKRRATVVTIALLLGSLFLSAASLALASPWVMWNAAMLLLAAFFFDLVGRSAWSLAPIWLLLLLALPLPIGADDALVFQLQTVASKWASLSLEFFRLNHLLSGHIIEVPGQKFLVEEACSGIRSLFALVAVTATFAVYERRGLVHALLLIGSSVCWSLLTNVLRILAIVLGQTWCGVNVSEGWMHQTLGIAVFLLALYMLFCTDQLILLAFDSKPAMRANDTRIRSGRELSESLILVSGLTGAIRLRLFSSWILAGVVFLMVGVPSFALAANKWLSIRAWATDSPPRLALAANTLPAEFNDWKRTNFSFGDKTDDASRGPHWASWTYESGSLLAVVSLDYPFYEGWHSLEVCYRGGGWDIDGWRLEQSLKLPDGSPRKLASFDISKGAGSRGIVLYSLFDRAGRVPTPPAGYRLPVGDWRKLIQQRIAVSRQSWRAAQQYYQLQVMMSGTTADLETHRSELLALFVAAQDRLADVVSAETRQ